MKYPAASHTAPTTHEREALRRGREARRAAFFAFIEEIFEQAPRHAASSIRAGSSPKTVNGTVF